MLNPSTADAREDDNTIRRCVGFAQHLGYGGIEVRNLFQIRTSNRKEMKAAHDPIGENADEHILELVELCDCIIAAWGKDGKFKGRGDEVKSLIPNMQCFGVTKANQPKHPLYIYYETPLISLPY